MEITFSLPHVFNGVSSHRENAAALEALLEGLIALNRAYLSSHSVAPLYQSGVRYKRTVIWDSIPALYKRGYGDCKSLTAALVAQYRHAGLIARPVFRFAKVPQGGTLFHILVYRESHPDFGEPPNTTIFEDPSKALGMSGHENDWVNA